MEVNLEELTGRLLGRRGLIGVLIDIPKRRNSPVVFTCAHPVVQCWGLTPPRVDEPIIDLNAHCHQNQILDNGSEDLT